MLSIHRTIQIIIIILLLCYISRLDKNVESFSKTLGIVIPTRKLSYIDRRYLKDLDYYLKANYPYLSFKFIILKQLNREYNRGALYNIAVSEFDCDYYSFQDFETLPSGKADYSYPRQPHHLVDRTSKCKECIFKNGGVMLINKDDFIKLNGYNNKLYELSDSDFLNRIIYNFPNIKRCENNIECKIKQNYGRHIVRYEEQKTMLSKMKNYNAKNKMNTGFNELKYKILEKQSIMNFPKNCIVLGCKVMKNKK